ncbi:MAG: ROK family protein [Bacteroidetes bacterium]|nr:ROK family protein [Bacteroidota bacterium]
MNESKIIGIDLGATNIRAGVVYGGTIKKIETKKIKSAGTVEDVLADFYLLIDALLDKDVVAIGVGVPSVVDLAKGIVYDVQHIPSWKEVPLKAILEAKYKIPVFVNNDANCFALGEFHFGKGKDKTEMIGLTIGTGLGAGAIVNKHLFAGPNCGVGEFGMVDYLDHNYEYYASGQYFSHLYNLNGEEVFERAKAGDALAQQYYSELGTHLGNAIKLIMYTFDASYIVLGGSVRHAYPYFEKNMWARIQTFAYGHSITNLKIELSDLDNAGILGAAGLYYDQL